MYFVSLTLGNFLIVSNSHHHRNASAEYLGTKSELLNVFAYFSSLNFLLKRCFAAVGWSAVFDNTDNLQLPGNSHFFSTLLKNTFVIVVTMHAGVSSGLNKVGSYIDLKLQCMYCQSAK